MKRRDWGGVCCNCSCCLVDWVHGCGDFIAVEEPGILVITRKSKMS